MSGNDKTSVSRRNALKTLGATGVAVSGVGFASTTAIAAGPTADFTISPLPPAEGESVTFDASPSSGDITKYEWTYDQAEDEPSGVIQTGQTITESFVADDFEIELTVTDSNGNTDTATRYINVYTSVSPDAVIKMQRNGGGEITFDGSFSSSTRGSIEKYEWSYDAAPDEPTGTIQTGPVIHEHFSSGDFNVELRVTDSKGRTGEEQITISV